MDFLSIQRVRVGERYMLSLVRGLLVRQMSKVPEKPLGAQGLCRSISQKRER